MLMREQHVGQRLHVFAGVSSPRGVARAVEQDPFGLRRDRGFKLRRGHLKTRFRPAFDHDGLAAAEQHHVGIAGPVRRGDHHLVAGVQARDESVVEHMLAAIAHRDLRGLVIEAVFALQLARDRGLQFGAAVGRGVFRVAGPDGGHAGVGHVLGRIEIRLAGRQPDHVVTRGLHFHCLGVERHGRGGANDGKALCDDGHGKGLLSARPGTARRFYPV